MIVNHLSQYWKFEEVIDKQTCKDIIEVGLSKIEQRATVDSDRNKEAQKQVRSSKIAWIEDQWIFDLFSEYINQANFSSGWNFEIDWFEPVQFTKYLATEKGHYDWHVDISRPYGFDKKDWQGKQRKISAVISLSDPNDYEGGDFEFNFKNNAPGLDTNWPVPELKKQGSIIVFPSYHWHRVKPVTKGTRYSLVVWVLGKPFN
jgi:PKHD-type hydroxylase